ncbi:unnamed protein product [Brassicogethes aeneus]|uniref:Endonuclease-reverse transcriptase n=1 Tax=Brassicogethes aeneus TaxID=1431903 RepID=A0A9P0FIV6_BRAAE|nr:unnamed protein product [Brassicogethes aeneus]
MRYLRAVKGLTRRDRIRNETVRAELDVEPILDSIKKQQLKWFGHMVRMEEDRQAKRIWQTKTIQKRPRGRPKKTWNDVVAENLEKRNKTWNEARTMARDKNSWTGFVHNLT